MAIGESIGGKKGINKLKTAGEDIYEPAPDLADYGNDLIALLHLIKQNFEKRNRLTPEKSPESYQQGFDMQDLEAVRRNYVVRTMEGMYLSPESDQYYQASQMRPVIAKYPQKVARMNALAGILNKCQDVVTFKQAYNGMLRMLYGKKDWNRHGSFEGDECNPDRLDVDAVLRTLPN